MKKGLFFVALTLLGLVTFVSCKKDDEQEVKTPVELKLEATELMLSINETKTLKVLSGNGNYKASSSDATVVKVSMDKDVLSVTSLKAGKATLTVTDASNKKASVQVSVISDIALEKPTLEMELGATALVAITSEETTFEVAVTNDNVKASVEGKVLKLTAEKAGTTEITVSNKASGKSAKITVTVTHKDFEVVQALNVNVGEAKTIDVMGGSGTFSVVSADTNIATAQFANGKITVTGVTNGTTTLTVTDTQSNKSKQVNVTVKKLNRVVFVGHQISNAIANGYLGFIRIDSKDLPEVSKITSDNPKVAVFEKIGKIGNETFLFVKGLAEGRTTIKVTDDEKVHELSITVIATPELEIDGTEFEIDEISTGVDVSVNGSGDFEVTIADTSLVTLGKISYSFSGTLFYISFERKSNGAGETTATIKDKVTGQQKTITIAIAEKEEE